MRRLFLLWIGLIVMLLPLSGAAMAGDSEMQQAAAAPSANSVTVGPGLPVWMDGKEFEFTPASETVNGMLFAPASKLADMLGVKWETAAGLEVMTAIKANSGNITATFYAGTSSFEKNGVEMTLPVAPYIDDDWLYVPLRAFAEAFGYIVRWDELKHAVVVEKEWTALPAIGTEEKLQELLGTAQSYGGMKMRSEAVQSDVKEAAPNASAAGTESSTASAAPAASSADYSGTNVQVAGVDEGDLAKTDGTYLYQISGRQLSIVRAVPASELKIASTVKFDDASFTPSELYVDGDKLVVFGRSRKPEAKTDGVQQPNVAPAPSVTEAAPAVKAAPVSGIAADTKIMIVPYGVSVTKAIVIDIADRGAPKIIRTVELEGNAVATRKIGSIVYIVANSSAYPYLKGSGTASGSPSYRDSAVEGADWEHVGLPNVRYFPGPILPSYLLVGGLDLSRPDRPLTLSSFLGAGQNVYVSQQSLYVTQTQYARLYQPASSDQSSIALHSAGGPATTVYRFKLDDGYVRYTSKGDVPGTPLNQFSMDENDDVFRIATTREEGNALYTLDQSMQIIGQLERIAPGERIYSARFLGGRAYLVTFKQVDPLFVIDVSNPRSPAVLGALKIPGYSDYLHPYDATHLIGFGKETVQDGSYGTVLYQGMKVSLFDVSDVSHPVEMFKTTIGDRGTESDLLHDHKALLFNKDKGLLAFPVSVREVQAKDGNGGKDLQQYGSLTFEGAYVYRLDLTNGFQLKGGITHVTAQDQLKTGYDGYDPTLAVKRALYIGNTIYTVSDGAVKANDLDTLSEIGQLRISDR